MHRISKRWVWHTCKSIIYLYSVVLNIMNVWPDFWKGSYTHIILQLWWSITLYAVKPLSWNLLSLYLYDIAVCLQNFNIDKPQAELCLLKFEKLDACIRLLFPNPVTYTAIVNNKESTL